MSTEPAKRRKQLAWFVGLWLAGVAVLGLIALLVRGLIALV